MKRLLLFAAFPAALLLGVSLWRVLQPQAAAVSEKTLVVEAAENAPQTAAQNRENRIKKVSFENVGFAYDTSLFSDAKGEIVAALPLNYPSDKPDNVYPEHINFVFSNSYLGEKISGDEFYSKIRLHIYRIEEKSLPISDKNLYVNFAQADFADLKRTLAKNARIPAAASKQLPYIPFADASQAFYARAQTINFKNGTGLAFLTQWQQDETVICNERLQYVYQGLTADNKHFVLLEFAIASPDLPETGDKFPVKYNKLNDSYESFGTKQYKVFQNLYQKYALETAVALDKTPADKFAPNLDKIESLIRSLEVK